jgi:ABC-2 type transport system permease protein
MKEFFLFELRYRLKRPATYIYFGIFFLFSFLAITTDVVGIGGGDGKVLKNAPIVINTFVTILSIFGVFVVSAVMGVPVYRDIEHKTHTFFFTLPFTKSQYLGGRFLGSFVILFIIFIGVALGMFLGSIIGPLFGWIEASKVAPFSFLAYANSYLLIMLPNLLLMSAIFFSLVALTRSVVATYTGCAILFVGYIIGLTLSEDMENQRIAAIVDPFGYSAANLATKYWTVAEQNILNIPLTNELLINRLIWVVFSLLLLGFTFYRFNYEKFLGLKGAKAKKKKRSDADEELIVKPTLEKLPVIEPHFSGATYFRQMLSMSEIEFKNIVKDFLFISILFAGVVFLLLDGWYTDRMFGTQTYPVTYTMLSIKQGNFILMAYGILIFFSGEMVWKERTVQFAQINDALPIPNWLMYGSKIIALVLVCVLLVLTIMFAGIAVQTAKGYFNYELDLYFKDLFLVVLPDFILFAALSFFVHILVNNKFIGFFIIIAFWLSMGILYRLDYKHPLYRFSSGPSYIYSDMNGFGHYVEGLFWMTFYWFCFAGLMVIAGNLLWNRGIETGFDNRIKMAEARLKRPARLGLLLFFLAFAASGLYILYNTNFVNRYKNGPDWEKAEYEKKYKKYENVIQPKITTARINADIFPEALKTHVKGVYTLKNRSAQSIDSLHVMIPEEVDILSIKINNKKSTPVLSDRINQYYIYRLTPALRAGEEMPFEFEIEAARKGFNPVNERHEVVYNGSFFNNNLFPSFGYAREAEVEDNDKRKKNKLTTTRVRMASLNDKASLERTYISRDADWIDFEATVSTSPDQIAIAPGYLQKEWTENGRRYFRYKMDAPILNFYSFLSARYEVRKDKWKDVNIEIYYHKGHTYNLDRMVNSIKKSLDYFTTNFSPYQHKQVRILEFPRYETFAQSFPNTIPYSESIGFIAKVNNDDEKDIDYPFYVTAHEVAHQWWAHQVIGGNVQGSTLMSESLSQYSALMVMEKEYGPQKMKRFLKYELDRYLSGRRGEKEKELPLYKVENQGYIHYEKGSLVLYALKDYIGEAKLNKALKTYVDSVGFQKAPFTNSLQFMRFIERETPDSLQYLVDDLFRKITLYENRVSTVAATPQNNNSYVVNLVINSKKVYADSLGNEKEARMADWVDIGVFTEKEVKGKIEEVPLYLEKHRITSGQNNLQITVKEKPTKAGIDPYNKLIDRNPDDNVKRVE